MPAAAIKTASSIGQAILGSNAASDAAKAQQQASQANIGANNAFLGNVQGDVQPIIGAGNQSANAFTGLLGLGGLGAQTSAFSDFLKSTPYQFMLSQGLQGQAFLNAPNLQSGATAKALGNYAQGMAGNAIYPYLSMLQGEQGLGLQGSGIYANTGLGVSNLNQQSRNLAANAQGFSDMYGANAWGNALNGISNLASSSFGSGGNPFANIFGGGGGGASPGAAASAFDSGTWGLA